MNKINFNQEIDRIIKTAIQEDVGAGDFSSLAAVPPTKTGRARLLVKEQGILAGVQYAQRVFGLVDERLQVEVLKTDGEKMKQGEVAFYVSGPARSLLKSERLMLNGMQRMSAIATKTHAFTEILKGTKTKILDTRKTTPGIRAIEKWAVRIGGGSNHRMGLFDMIMLKDNHIDFAGGIAPAIRSTREYLSKNDLDLKIEVEARSLEEIEEILSVGGVDRILIDNFNYEDTRIAVRQIGNTCETESSGNITLDTARKYAECGVDFISSGALTHSVHNLDLSLEAM